MTIWIDFKELRKGLDFAEVLRHYKVELKLKGDQHHGFCPLPLHEGRRNSASFSANVKKAIWQCFGCGQKGNVLDFAVLMEKANPDSGEEVRKVALKLQEQFLGKAPATELPERRKKVEDAKTCINAPLDFELKGLDARHPYLQKRGFTAETIERFGLGFCSRGFLKDRIAIPLHDGGGRLIGYAGRAVDDSTVSEDNPKYRFPGKRERNWIIYEFHKSAFLYNGHRLPLPLNDLIVVEGFPGVWWLFQSGIENSVGLMGASCSEEQADAIVSLVAPAGRVWVFTDGDDAGVRCAESILIHVAPHRFTRWVKMKPGGQPTDFSPSALKECFAM